ncbi:MAG: anthranilate synthase component I family protein [Myxococcota bacterium]
MKRYHPEFDEFRRLAGRATVVPVHREVVSDGLTPVAAAATVGTGLGGYLLESVIGGEKWGRYSFVGLDPDVIVRGVADRFDRIVGDRVETERGVDPFERLREVLAGYEPPPTPWLPRFWGGAVGYVSYDAVRRFEPTVGAALGPDDDPEFCFAVGGPLLVFDNLKQTVRVVVPVPVGEGAELRAAYDGAVARIEAVVGRLASPARLRMMAPPDSGVRRELPPSSFDEASFCAAVEKAKEYIRAGDIFQVVPSQRFRLPAQGVNLFDVYRAMRVVNPSPYMYFLRLPEVTIAGASPETLVRLEGGVAEVRPIAGTRPRGATEEEDHAHERDMLDDPKEVAEHVMLVDLGRNDLGRVCVPGTVRLTERMVVERYSHVMHIVSNVAGQLSAGRDALDLLRATFPAGTLSGAPKVRAMQIIEELEPERRGIYGGAVGYIGFGGNMDVAIAIRTIVQKGDELHLQAGAGLVEASQPEAEYQETINKARAGLVAVAAGSEPED